MRSRLKRQTAESLTEQALETWGPTVFRVALGQTGSPADAEDICQEVFLRLLKSTTKFSSEEHLKAWLIRVAINCSHDVLRSRSRHGTAPLDDHLAEAERKLAESQRSGSDDAGVIPFDSSLWDIVGALPEDQRAAVNLFYVEGYGIEEASRILNCSSGAFRMRLHRARERLRRMLGPSPSSTSDPSCERSSHV